MNNNIKIYFIENSFDYNGDDLNNSEIGGSEKTLINITNSLANQNEFKIKVFNNTTKPINKNKVEWLNINQIQSNDIPDYVISMSDVNLFKLLSCKKNYLWSHSVQSIEKFIRKKQFSSFIKFKPILILEGDYHYNTRNFLTAFYGKRILKLAPDYDFINMEIKNSIPNPIAIFTTKSDRNLKFLIDCWYHINDKINESKLYINPPYQLSDLDKKKNIFVRIKGDKKLLIKDLINARLFLTPGHKTEVFCLAAEEARELCVPIVTMGYGCLYERVEHGVTGYIAKTKKEFIDFSYLILNNNSVYNELRENLVKKRNIRNYKHVMIDLLRILDIYV